MPKRNKPAAVPRPMKTGMRKMKDPSAARKNRNPRDQYLTTTPKSSEMVRSLIFGGVMLPFAVSLITVKPYLSSTPKSSVWISLLSRPGAENSVMKTDKVTMNITTWIVNG